LLFGWGDLPAAIVDGVGEIIIPLPVSGGGVDVFEEVSFSDVAPGSVGPEGSSVTLGSAVGSVVPP
jgi:hypothetical protein